MGSLPYSLKYLIAGTVRCASDTTTSELNILSCVEILKHDSKVDVRFTASMIADIILAKVYLSDCHGQTDVISETQSCDI